MNIFGRILFLFFLGSPFVYGEWQHVKEIRLKKDETQKVQVLYNDKKRLLTFRWTLFTNDELVIHRAFDGYVAQNVLSLNLKNQSFRVMITPKGTKYSAVSYIFVTFKRFDKEKGEALFDLLLHDDKKKIVLKYLKVGG